MEGVEIAVQAASEDEAGLVERLRHFEERAWNEIYDTYFPRLFRYLYLQTSSQEVAEELTSQVFEEACNRIGTYRYRGSPLSAWLYRVAHNRMVDWRRKRKELPLVDGDSQPDMADRVADRDEIATAMRELTPEQQQVLILRHVEGHTSASAGGIMGKSAGAVRSLEFRALATLRRSVSEPRK